MPPVDSSAIEARFLGSIADISGAEWNALCGTDYPFLRHEFLLNLETSGCVGGDSGWRCLHLTLYRNDALIAVMPAYLKSHSYGEYVFDWSWADAWHRSGLEYYPKLLTAIPFTPATGPRLGLAEDESLPALLPVIKQAIEQLASDQQLSSWHLLFPQDELREALTEQGMSPRVGSQFHWFNRDYSSFDDFLSRFNSRKRKSLRKERKRVAEQGIELKVFEGEDISAEHWRTFHHFYQMTYAKRSGHGGYLTREFFPGLSQCIPEHCVMVLAYRGEDAVAGALYFRSSDTLYGRYWGCAEEIDCLHFEACYYQGIEYCIRHGLQRFDPGAQGEHKIQRGFEPVETWSCHWIADPRFADAIDDFTRRESDHIAAYIEQATTYLPFKEGA